MQQKAVNTTPMALIPCAPAAALSEAGSTVSPVVNWLASTVAPRMVAATAFGTEADVGGDGGGSLELTAVALDAGNSLGGSGRVSSIREKACLFRSDSVLLAPVRLPLLPLCLALGRAGGVVLSSKAAGICSGAYQNDVR